MVGAFHINPGVDLKDRAVSDGITAGGAKAPSRRLEHRMVKYLAHILIMTTVGHQLTSCQEQGSRPRESEVITRSQAWSDGLHTGMSMNEVRERMGTEELTSRVERLENDSRSDPLDWDTQWRLRCTFVDRDSRVERTVGFEAWSSSASTNRPPDSAFRLRQWND